MATLLEINECYGVADLRRRTQSGVMIVAAEVLAEVSGANLASRKSWAAKALSSTEDEGLKALRYLLGVNAGATKAAILAVTDATMLTQIRSMVSTGYGA